MQFCPKAYGCAFDEIMTDPRAVYIKLDDDLVFIKDGSMEHLVYQVAARLVRSSPRTWGVWGGCSPAWVWSWCGGGGSCG